MEVYARVRRSVQVDGMSERQAAREYGLSRKTIRKMMAYSAPPGYQRKKPVARPKLGPWLGVVDQILEDDESRPKKQRHTARRIYDRLKQEHAFTGGYTCQGRSKREPLGRRKRGPLRTSAENKLFAFWGRLERSPARPEAPAQDENNITDLGVKQAKVANTR